jgi:hypothetical protein
MVSEAWSMVDFIGGVLSGSRWNDAPLFAPVARPLSASAARGRRQGGDGMEAA